MAFMLPHSVPVLLEVVVAAPGTGVPLSAVAHTFTRLAVLYAGKAAGVNAGNVFLGEAAVDVATHKGIELVPGTAIELVPPEGEYLDLNAIYIDAANAGDGVRGHYFAVPAAV